MPRHGKTSYAEPRATLMTVNELARQLGVSRDSVYRLVRAGEITGYRIGERLRFRPEEVDEFLERRREPAP